jgi:hypothetical protein
MYIKMDPIQLRREIEDEMRRTRLDKARLYDLLLKIVDTSVGGEASAGPAGPKVQRALKVQRVPKVQRVCVSVHAPRSKKHPKRRSLPPLRHLKRRPPLLKFSYIDASLNSTLVSTLCSIIY